MIHILITTMSAIVVADMPPAFEPRAHPAWEITVEWQGRVYFSDLETVRKIDTREGLSPLFLPADLPERTSIWRGGDGNMYYAATHSGQ